MVLYVFGEKDNLWHWCKNCEKYPKENEIESTTEERPAYDLCPECYEQEKNSNKIPPAGATDGKVF